MPVVAIFFPVQAAIAITAVVHLLNNLLKLGLLWKMAHWPVALRFGVPAIIAAFAGAFLLIELSSLPEITRYSWSGNEFVITPIKLIVGGLLLVFATAELLPVNTNIPQKYLPLGGVLSGFFGGLSGHQGAFRSAFLLASGLDKNAFVATNAAIAAMVDITRITVYGLSLSVIAENVGTQWLLVALGAAAAGTLVGKFFLHKITFGVIRVLIAVLLYILGALLMAGVI